MKAVLVVACLGLAACTSDLETSAPTSGPAPSPAPTPGPAVEPAQNTVAAFDGERARVTSDLFAVGVAPASPAPFVCRANAFCEDFEEHDWKTRWADLVMTPGGEIDVRNQSASAGRAALRVSSHDPGATAFLLHEPGDVVGEWSGLLAFALRVDEVPAHVLGGPELTVKTVDGPVTIRIGMRPEGLVLEQLSEATCLRDRCQPSSKVIAAAQPNRWYRVRLGVEVNPRQAPPYGRVEVRVDDGELQGTDLTVPFHDGSVAMRAGITQGDARSAFADLDDVTMLIRH